MLLCTLLLWPLNAQDAQRNPPARRPAPPVVEEAPPEEDVDQSRVVEYTLNPLQSEKELRIGNYYAKKGSFKAAAARFLEATRWNPSSVDAFLKLGEARERLGDKKAAGEAYAKVLELDPENKMAAALKKKLGAIKK